MDIKTVCLDTDILIDHLRGEEEAVRQILELEASGSILSTTTINAFELYYGAQKTEKGERNRDSVKKLLSRLVVYDFTERAAEKAGEIVAHLEAEGNPIEFRDAFIGATAITNKSALFTRNIRHFDRIPLLRLHTLNNIVSNTLLD